MWDPDSAGTICASHQPTAGANYTLSFLRDRKRVAVEPLPPSSLESSASRGPPRFPVQLFVAQAFDRIELGGANRRNGAEQDADQGRDDDGDDGGEAGNGDAILGEETNGEGDGESDDDTEDAADE